MHGATFVDLDGDGLIDSLIATGGMQSVSDLPVPGANQAFKSGDHGMSDPQYPHANDAVLLWGEAGGALRGGQKSACDAGLALSLIHI